MNNMCDLIQYIVMPKIRYAPDIGTYTSYDIAAMTAFHWILWRLSGT